MSFHWSTIVPGVTEADATHVNEIMINVDALADDLGLPHYAWVNLPVAPREIITAVQGEEVRDGLDYIDNNQCPTYNTVYCASVCGVDKTPHDGAVDAANFTVAFSDHYIKNV